eukprot:7442510-Pyramimonas_sp.AAC.1
MEDELCDVLDIVGPEKNDYTGMGHGYRIVDEPILERAHGPHPKYSKSARAVRKYQVWLEELRYLRNRGHSCDDDGVRDLVRTVSYTHLTLPTILLV